MSRNLLVANLGRFFLALVLLLGLGGGGCARSNGLALKAERPRVQQRTFSMDPEYRVGAGDVLRIASPGLRQDRMGEVHSDGRLYLQDVSLWVDGSTASEIARKLSEWFEEEYSECSVRVERCGSQFVFLYGPSSEEGHQAIAYRGKESLRDLLARVRCPECQRGYRVQVVRPGRTVGADPEIVSLQLDRFLQDPDRLCTSIYLQPNDYVYVQKNRGKPGPLTRIYQSQWYQRPTNWFKGMLARNKDPLDSTRR